MTDNISLLLVFAAGLLSFLSPCVLPLIPSYFSVLTGVGLAGNQGPSGTAVPGFYRPRLMKTAAGFVLGFSAVFITLGILVSATFYLMGGVSAYINLAAGIIVIILGLNVIFDFLSVLNYENRPLLRKLALSFNQTQSFAHGLPAAFFAGAAFGAGWTPCIGPVLTGILLIAGQSGQTAKAVFYLTLYSAGLALPFLLAAFFFDFFLKHTSRLRFHLPLIRRISGILLVVIGIMILTGRYSALNILVQKWIPAWRLL